MFKYLKSNLVRLKMSEDYDAYESTTMGQNVAQLILLAVIDQDLCARAAVRCRQQCRICK